MPELSCVFCLYFDRVHAKEGFSQETDISDDVSETLLARCVSSFLFKITVSSVCLTVMAIQQMYYVLQDPIIERESLLQDIFFAHTVCDLLAHEPTWKQ